KIGCGKGAGFARRLAVGVAGVRFPGVRRRRSARGPLARAATGSPRLASDLGPAGQCPKTGLMPRASARSHLWNVMGPSAPGPACPLQAEIASPEDSRIEPAWRPPLKVLRLTLWIVLSRSRRADQARTVQRPRVPQLTPWHALTRHGLS